MPKKVDLAAEEAERLHRELYPEQYSQEDGDSGEQTQKKEDSDGEPPQGDGPADAKTDESVKPDDTAPSSSDGQAKATDTDTPPQKKTEEDWQQKYYVLKGKYDAEVPRLHSDLQALRTVVQDLQTQVKDAVHTKTADTKKDEPDDAAVEFVKNEYPDIYNAMVKMFERGKADAPKGDEKALIQRIEAVERVAVETAEDRFFRDLGSEVQDWKTHKDDPRFLDWLKQEDPLTGTSRLALAQQAQSALDGKRIAKFYKSFIKEVVGEKKEETPNKEEQKKDGKGIEKFVAPPASGGKGAGNKVNTDNETVKTSDIKKFYDDAQKGRYRGREAEFARMEAKIDKAVSEGKVVKG